MTARAAYGGRVAASPVHSGVDGTRAAVLGPRADGVASNAHLGQADDAVKATTPAPRTAFAERCREKALSGGGATSTDLDLSDEHTLVLLRLGDATVAGCAAPVHRITGGRFRSACRRWRMWRRRCAARSRPKWSCHAAHSSGASGGRSRQGRPARFLLGGRRRPQFCR
ncbi:hypothetical protein LDHU3_31.1540:CDS1 [Leishmania donovani]|uniref:Hypothetical_protein n=1 Tax=Leishmania donovani TaxID=5661 RepID=A0A6J8FKL4_LEIDO|nr:hypothetical protein LDHU3_31.1540:CDS1 [Leishmania donovani]VDZ47127.1 hypothetical_protein [Leishmania donovani]